eukprot:scaffold1000_cov68-Phaeocystis_antarctica.AAC.10
MPAAAAHHQGGNLPFVHSRHGVRVVRAVLQPLIATGNPRCRDGPARGLHALSGLGHRRGRGAVVAVVVPRGVGRGDDDGVGQPDVPHVAWLGLGL